MKEEDVKKEFIKNLEGNLKYHKNKVEEYKIKLKIIGVVKK